MVKKSGTALVLLLIMLAQIWCLYIEMRYPYIGMDVMQNEQQQWAIRELDHQGLSKNLELQNGDVLREVDGVSPGKFPTVLKWHAIEQAQNMVLSRDGYDFTISMQKNSSVTLDLLPLFQELLWLLMAGLLHFKMNRSASARLLALVFLCGGLIWMSFGGSIRGDAISKIVITTFMLALPVVFAHFLIAFFREKSGIRLPAGWLPYAYGFVLLMGLSKLTYFFPPAAFSVYRYSIPSTLVAFSLGFAYCIAMLIAVYVKNRRTNAYVTKVVRNLGLVLLLSFVPMIGFSFIPQIIFQLYTIHALYTSLLALVFPMYFAYLISSNQIYNIGLVLRRFAFAAMVAIVPSAALTGLYALLFRSDDDLKHLLFIFLSSGFLISLILYGVEYVTTRLESFFFPKKFLLNTALKNLAARLGTISSYRDLQELVLADIVHTLEIEGAAIVFQYTPDLSESIRFGQLDEDVLLDPPLSLRRQPAYSSFDIQRHEEYNSLLVLGPKKNNAALAKEERQWLSLVVSYLAVSLENLHLIRKQAAKLKQLSAQLPGAHAAEDMHWFRKLMFELQEEERLRIASDLHDTTMQDLFFLKQRFSAIADKYAWNTEDQGQIRSIVNFVEMINVGLRQSCFDLNPYLLKESGLVETLELYVDKEQQVGPFAIDFAVQQRTVIESRLELPVKKHLFRIVQELIQHARKHSLATAVRLQLSADGGACRLVYEDDGTKAGELLALAAGVSRHAERDFGHSAWSESQATRRSAADGDDSAAGAGPGVAEDGGANDDPGATGHGLAQLQSRILHLGGQLDVRPSAGGGVTMIVLIPMKEAAAV